MRTCRLWRFDSFRAARADLNELFSAHKSPEHLARAVRQYTLHTARRMQRIDGKHRSFEAQRRSWLRTNATLILQEAKRRRHFLVAQEAMKVIIEHPDLFPTVEAAWLKDALSACESAAELQQLGAALHAQVGLLPPGSAQQARSHTITALFQHTFGDSLQQQHHHHQRAAQLDDGEEEEELALVALAEGQEQHGDEAHALAAENPEEVVARALAVRRPSPAGSSLVPADKRAMAALRRLQRHREMATVAPNSSFARYMVQQQLVKDEGECAELFRAMRARPRHVGFRVHGTHPLAAAAKALVEARAAVRPVAWLPASSGAYILSCGPEVPYDQLVADRQLLRALAAERIASYQSVSSMLPVHYLQPRPGERVLDLCASPGGKSSFLLDYMQTAHQGGCVIANEALESRAAALAARVGGTSPLIGVVRCDGAQLPAAPGSFDKVLVDAPCSGEGRLGRDPMAWRLWHPRRALEYFPHQVRLLRQAAVLCRVGGTIVYATCTMNPLENEAVVSTVLREAGGALELVRPPALHPQHRQAISGQDALAAGIFADETAGPALEALDRMELSHGLSSWCVPSPSGGFYRHPNDLAKDGSGNGGDGGHERIAAGVLQACFPPSSALTPADPQRESRLESQLRTCCRRVLPHRTDGAEAFFVCVIKKTGLFSDAVATPTREELPSWQTPRPTERVSVNTDTLLGTGAPSLLLQRHYVHMTAHSPTVQEYLLPFFHNTMADLVRFLRDSHYTCLWKEQEGLRLVTEEGLAAAGGIKTTTPTNATAELLDLGVLCFDAQGQLTEGGADLLGAYHRSTAPPPTVAANTAGRFLQIDLPYFQMLLSTRTLVVDDALVADVEEVRQPNALHRSARRPSSAAAAFAAAPSKANWASQLLMNRDLLQEGGEGNAIVMLAVPRTASIAAAGSQSNLLQAAMQRCALPVKVERVAAGSKVGLRLTLRLSATARHRTTAMIGRLLALGQRQLTRDVLHQHVHANAQQHASLTMPAGEVGGATLDLSQQQQRAVFGEPSRGMQKEDTQSDLFEL